MVGRGADHVCRDHRPAWRQARALGTKAASLAKSAPNSAFCRLQALAQKSRCVDNADQTRAVEPADQEFHISAKSCPTWRGHAIDTSSSLCFSKKPSAPASPATSWSANMVTRVTIGGKVTMASRSAPRVAHTGMPSVREKRPKRFQSPLRDRYGFLPARYTIVPSPSGPITRRGEGTCAFDRPDGSRKVRCTATRLRDDA